MAYCLQGLFGVNIPLSYGEGAESAFLRLQSEIIGRTTDESIYMSSPGNEVARFGLLARSVRNFANCRKALSIRRDSNGPRSSTFSITQRGVETEIEVPRSMQVPWARGYWLLLPMACGIEAEPSLHSYLVLCVFRDAGRYTDRADRAQRMGMIMIPSHGTLEARVSILQRLRNKDPDQWLIDEFVLPSLEYKPAISPSTPFRAGLESRYRGVLDSVLSPQIARLYFRSQVLIPAIEDTGDVDSSEHGQDELPPEEKNIPSDTREFSSIPRDQSTEATMERDDHSHMHELGSSTGVLEGPSWRKEQNVIAQRKFREKWKTQAAETPIERHNHFHVHELSGFTGTQTPSFARVINGDYTGDGSEMEEFWNS